MYVGVAWVHPWLIALEGEYIRLTLIIIHRKIKQKPNNGFMLGWMRFPLWNSSHSGNRMGIVGLTH